ncbi:hypothetical protein CLV56_2803 [Mumia flava]|uniref:MinD-like ATPase involved in chromosome partitioning or flagellar assembly n=1 Tax=Mumia flava TaxID=1348852 RepID=A0A0B2BNL3_9ACTN|nr:hypothetical protein [Mumia flava]PJJ58552.1 hypothetical protein CLV56_2803 [Mumia flava]
MSVPVLLAAGGEPWEADLVAAAVAADGLVVVRRCVDVADAVATAAGGGVRVALVSASLPGLDTDVVRRIAEQEVLVAAVEGPGPGSARERAGALGIGHVLSLTELDQVAELARRRSAERASTGPATAGGSGRAPHARPVEPGGTPGDEVTGHVGAGHVEAGREGAGGGGGSADGRVIAVWGPHGAPGRSTVALGLAGELAAAGRDTILADADLRGGSQAQALAMLDEVSGLLAAARQASAGRLDEAGLLACLRGVGPRLSVLTGPSHPRRSGGIRPAALEIVLETGRRLGDVVVDLGPGLEAVDDARGRSLSLNREALLAADVVVVVGTPDPVGLARLSRALLDLAELVVDPPVVVVNQVRGSLGWSEAEITSTLRRLAGVEPRSFVALDRTATDRCLVHGRTPAEAVPASALRQSLTRLARDITAGVLRLA